MDHKEVDIVIIGAGLTGLTLAYYLSKNNKKVALIEKSDKVGGVMQTHSEDGFVFEVGPTTGVIGTEEIVELFDDLKEDCSLEKTNEIANERWILYNNKWIPLPHGLLNAINTPLFSLSDKFRILGEPFRKKGTDTEESIADLVKRRLGKSFLDYAVDPFISGVYAGDPEQLIAKYALPKLYLLEQQYGGFIKGAMRKKKEPKTALQKRVSREVFSVKGGLGNMIGALENNISADHIYCNAENVSVNNVENGFQTEVTFTNGENISIKSSKVVSTIGGYALPDVFSFIEKEKLKPITKTNYAKLIQVAVGYKKWKGKNLNSFGGLVPTKEGKDYLGILFPGSLFEDRCPKGGALMSVFIGGVKKPEMIEKTDQEIHKIVQKAISSTLGEKDTPDLLKVFRYTYAIPQYDSLSSSRLEAIDSLEKDYPGLILAGNIRDGIGMADRVKQAKQIANLLI